MSECEKVFYTALEYSKRLGVNATKVRAWIKSGRLVAMNVSGGNVLPRYRILIADAERFEESIKPIPKTTSSRRKVTTTQSHFS